VIKQIEHFAIASSHPRKLAQWYIEHLNFTIVREIGPTVYIRDVNGVVLEFVPFETVPLPPKIRDQGLRHIAFAVDDIEATHRHLAAAGVPFEPELVVLPGMRLHFFQDPEGNFLHLVERALPLQPVTE